MSIEYDKIEEKLLKITGAESYKELAEKLGMTQHTFNGIHRRKTIPYDYIIDYCLKHHVDVNSIFADGQEKYRTIKRRDIKKTDMAPYKAVGYYTHKNQLLDNAKTYEEVMLLPKNTDIPENAIVVRVFSDELYPMLKAGDVILIDQDETENPNGVYLYIKNNDLHLRLIVPTLDKKVKISCTNQFHEVKTATVTDLALIGKLHAIL